MTVAAPEEMHVARNHRSFLMQSIVADVNNNGWDDDDDDDDNKKWQRRWLGPRRSLVGGYRGAAAATTTRTRAHETTACSRARARSIGRKSTGSNPRVAAAASVRVRSRRDETPPGHRTSQGCVVVRVRVCGIVITYADGVLLLLRRDDRYVAFIVATNAHNKINNSIKKK